ncbi:MAG: hypothetical protein ACRD5J_04785, partial [Nitrososphaeraceae archaeon]
IFKCHHYLTINTLKSSGGNVKIPHNLDMVNAIGWANTGPPIIYLLLLLHLNSFKSRHRVI